MTRERGIGALSSSPRIRQADIERGCPRLQPVRPDASGQTARAMGRPEDQLCPRAAKQRRCSATLRSSSRTSADGGHSMFFSRTRARQFDAADFELAQRMGKAFFSLFRCTARHVIAGVWLDDLLDGNRRLWLMDESMEASAPTEGAFGMRLFDAGQFHVGLEIVVPSDDETTEFSIQGMTRNGRVPFRHSLAVTLYSDRLSGSSPLSPELEDAFTSVLATMIGSGSGSRRVTRRSTKNVA